ncbi:acyl-CoA dehydrogenase family protein [Tomitella cavernea]|uniref:Acyl-CoA dehydrogenase family protein n=1 Tax=Tomitella cavernea TaxID=1387982 RepID=A0ABP9CXY5_9ACTN|nr:acyl-CoA dehydrogenase family protein [Tomitella cavernea]
MAGKNTAISLSEAGPFSDEQRELARTVRDVVAKRADSAAVRAVAESDADYDAKLWSLLCEQIGVAALAVPEEFDGIGTGYFESHLVLEELARGLVPSPMLGSAVICVQALLATGNDDACGRILAGIAAGETTAALCWSGYEGYWGSDDLEVGAEPAGDRWTLTGDTYYVLGGDRADVLLVAAGTDDGPGLFEVDPAAAGVERTATPAMDPTRPLSRVRFSAAAATPLATGAEVLDKVLAIAQVALSGEAVGAADRLLALTVEYTQQRKQFGRAIGSFQALKHRMADLYVLVETARSMSYKAAESLSPVDAATAKAYCTEAFQQVAGEAIQLHGGIAITWEHDAHLYFKRAHGCAQLFGQPREQLHLLESAAGLT